MFPFFVHSCLSPCLAVPFLSPLLSLSNSPSLCQLFLNPVIFPPFPPRSSARSAVLASETKEKMKAFVLQWLCIWCQSGSFFMTVQTVIRVCPYKEILPLMGLVWINYWRTHTSGVVWGRLSICDPRPRCVWVGFCGLPHSDTAESTPSLIRLRWSSLVCKLPCTILIM